MQTTPSSLITSALKKCGILGVGQTALPEDLNDAFNDLKGMLAQWSERSLIVYHLVDYNIQCSGNQSYKIGLTGNIIVPERPSKIEAALLRSNLSASIDYPLKIISAQQDYNNIAYKNTVGVSQYLYYDAAYPNGVIYLYPVPSSQYELHIFVKDELGKNLDLTTPINLPEEYYEAILYNLCVRIASGYQITLLPSILLLASTSLNTIKTSNLQIPLLQMPNSLISRRGNLQTFYSGDL